MFVLSLALNVNELIYELYHLTDKEIRIVEERQSESWMPEAHILPSDIPREDRNRVGFHLVSSYYVAWVQDNH